jgi:magnesium-transporting ATPase (P-type)
MQTFGVKSAFAKEIALLALCSVLCCVAIVFLVLSMSSERWLIVTSNKEQSPAMPWTVIDLGLTGGIATVSQEALGSLSFSFSYDESDKYCPNQECHSLRVSGVVCIILLCLGLVSCFATLLLAIVVMLQLSHVLAEKGPFGPYVNYNQAWRNCMAASLSSIVGTVFTLVALLSWCLILKESQENIPDFHLGAIKWRIGWIWALNILVPVMMILSSVLICCVVHTTQQPFSGYSSIT